MSGLLVFLGPGFGGLSGYWLSTWIQHGAPAFPWGTLLINVTGSALLTLVYGLLEGTPTAPKWRAFLGIGLLGGYTTFSAFSYETLRLLQEGAWHRALFYVVASVVWSVAGAYMGLRLASGFSGTG